MTAPRTGPPRLVGKLSVNTELGAFLGDTRIRLLEAIGHHGSISRAAKAVPMSYKAAWDALDAMNNLADSPLVESSVGGRHGGGTHLTDYGRRLVGLYRAVEQEYQGAVDRLARGMDAGRDRRPAGVSVPLKAHVHADQRPQPARRHPDRAAQGRGQRGGRS